MAMIYTISRWASTTMPRAEFHCEKRRKDSFADTLREQAYAMLKAHAKLDTSRAPALMKEVEELIAAYSKPLPLGYYRQDTLWLGNTDYYGKLDHIVISQTRR